MGQGIPVLGQPVGVERFYGVNDTGVKRIPLVLEHAPIAHLVGQRMFERVLLCREKVLLAKESYSLQVLQSAGQDWIRKTGYCGQDWHDHILPDSRSDLKQLSILH